MERHAPVQVEVSPDGHYLAVVQWPGPGTLVQLYETADLTEPVEELALAHSAHMARFSADSREVVWLTFDRAGDFGLGGVRLGDGPTEQRTFEAVPVPAELTGHELAPLGGGRVGLYGYSQPSADETTDPADDVGDHGPLRIAVADLDEGRLRFDVEVPTAADLEWSDDGTTYRNFGAAVAWDHVRDRAYVAHADRDAVLVVDLETGGVVTELQPREGSLPSPPLEAPPDVDTHDGPHEARWREALLSPSGSRLYTYGTGLRATDPGDEGVSGMEFELPVLLADLVTGELTVSDVTATRVLAVSADGAHLVAANSMWDVRPHRLRVLDSATLEPRWERVVDNPLAAEFSPDSSRVSVLSIPEQPSRADQTYQLDLLDGHDGSTMATMWFPEGPLDHRLRAGIVVHNTLGR